MKRVLTLSIALAAVLTITACSSNSNNKKGSSDNALYHGGETADDGHKLPPMPDSGDNDKTLLGIDTNDNGIRDDVEIYIYNRFQGYTNSKVEREIAKQWARTAAQLIQNPETAYEDKKYEIEDRALDCMYYYYDVYLKNVTFNEGLKYRLEHDVLDERLDDAIFNTKERIKAYFRYNASMGGHVFSDRGDAAKDNCDFDPDPLIEGTL